MHAERTEMQRPSGVEIRDERFRPNPFICTVPYLPLQYGTTPLANLPADGGGAAPRGLRRETTRARSVIQSYSMRSDASHRVTIT